MPQPYRSQLLDHLGLVAGMFDELGIGAVIDQATQHTPETRMVTVGHAAKAMVLNGLGFVNQQLSRVPLFFQHNPTQRLIAPGIEAQHLHDETLGRALAMLYDYGVTALYSLMAVTAAQRVGLTPRFAPLDCPSFHVNGRYHRSEEPNAPIMHMTRGDSRAHRPDLNHVMLDVILEHQAGIPLLMQPLSGNTSDASDFGQVVSSPIAPLHTTYGTTYLVADSALYSSVSVPYHIGNGWGGGLVPIITTSAYLSTNSLGWALAYPIGLPLIMFLIAIFVMRETRKHSIWEEGAIEATRA